MTPNTRPRSARTSRDAFTESFSCTACGASIQNRATLRILRHDDTPAECDAVEFVHDECASTFASRQPEDWTVYTADSPEAAWFLPVMIRWP